MSGKSKGKSKASGRKKPAASPRAKATSAPKYKTKIPAFAYSLRNKSASAYKDRARVLGKTYGVTFGFDVSKKLTPARKGAITKARKKFAQFLNPENGFRFVMASKKKIAAAVRAGSVTKAQVTKRGIFIQLPDTRKPGESGGTKRDTRAKVRIQKDGTLKTTVGNFTSEIKVFKSADVLKNPEAIAKEAKKRGAEFVMINIRGARGSRRYDIAQFMRYITKGTKDAEAFLDVIRNHTESGEGAFQNFLAVEFTGYDWSLESGDEDEPEDEDESE